MYEWTTTDLIFTRTYIIECVSHCVYLCLYDSLLEPALKTRLGVSAPSPSLCVLLFGVFIYHLKYTLVFCQPCSNHNLYDKIFYSFIQIVSTLLFVFFLLHFFPVLSKLVFYAHGGDDVEWYFMCKCLISRLAFANAIDEKDPFMC